MNIVIAMDSFKGSISSIEGSQAILEGIHDVNPDAQVTSLPLADGGEGTVDAVVHATSGEYVKTKVTGPLHNKVNAKYGITGDGKTAVIEVAEACGLPLVQEEQRNPLLTTTYGVGELIRHAMDNGCRHFVIGLGGSATNDAGVGMLQALGAKFYNDNGNEASLGGRVLEEINRIDLLKVDSLIKECTFKVACDVNNPLYGENGAANIFGPQKGATEEIVKELDRGLRHFAEVVEKELNLDIHSEPGSGAAGGLGAAFSGFLKGTLESGVELILDLINIEQYFDDCDLVITGEGKLDRQTSMGKVPVGVAKRAKAYNIPVIALAGAVNQDELQLNDAGIAGCFSIIQSPITIREAMDREVTYQNLKFTTSQIINLFKAMKK
ncbi:glycerate kinase family protein [Piscibacillus salipiscarius]|uniref:Glycerate kinase n=1 Tax=Piscibacillus salipiscarius TaxID=299480 RepID=A0ABW5Q876_9BACI|nr:glycerate kinase [Piscibacillus salipiscarius]